MLKCNFVFRWMNINFVEEDSFLAKKTMIAVFVQCVFFRILSFEENWNICPCLWKENDEMFVTECWLRKTHRKKTNTDENYAHFNITFHASRHDIFDFFFSMFIKFSFISTSRYKIRFISSARLLNQRQYEINSSIIHSARRYSEANQTFFRIASRSGGTAIKLSNLMAFFLTSQIL